MPLDPPNYPRRIRGRAVRVVSAAGRAATRYSFVFIVRDELQGETSRPTAGGHTFEALRKRRGSGILISTGTKSNDVPFLLRLCESTFRPHPTG